MPKSKNQAFRPDKVSKRLRDTFWQHNESVYACTLCYRLQTGSGRWVDATDVVFWPQAAGHLIRGEPKSPQQVVACDKLGCRGVIVGYRSKVGTDAV